MTLFLVTCTEFGKPEHVLVDSFTREGAKSAAQPILGGWTDDYMVVPLAPDSERVHLVGLRWF